MPATRFADEYHPDMRAMHADLTRMYGPVKVGNLRDWVHEWGYRLLPHRATSRPCEIDLQMNARADEGTRLLVNLRSPGWRADLKRTAARLCDYDAAHEVRIERVSDGAPLASVPAEEMLTSGRFRLIDVATNLPVRAKHSRPVAPPCDCMHPDSRGWADKWRANVVARAAYAGADYVAACDGWTAVKRSLRDRAGLVGAISTAVRAARHEADVGEHYGSEALPPTDFRSLGGFESQAIASGAMAVACERLADATFAAVVAAKSEIRSAKESTEALSLRAASLEIGQDFESARSVNEAVSARRAVERETLLAAMHGEFERRSNALGSGLTDFAGLAAAAKVAAPVEIAEVRKSRESRESRESTASAGMPGVSVQAPVAFDSSSSEEEDEESKESEEDVYVSARDEAEYADMPPLVDAGIAKSIGDDYADMPALKNLSSARSSPPGLKPIRASASKPIGARASKPVRKAVRKAASHFTGRDITAAEFSDAIVGYAPSYDIFAKYARAESKFVSQVVSAHPACCVMLSPNTVLTRRDVRSLSAVTDASARRGYLRKVVAVQSSPSGIGSDANDANIVNLHTLGDTRRVQLHLGAESHVVTPGVVAEVDATVRCEAMHPGMVFVLQRGASFK